MNKQLSDEAYQLVAEAWRLMDAKSPKSVGWHLRASKFLNADRTAVQLEIVNDVVIAEVVTRLASAFDRHIAAAGLTDHDSVTMRECKDAIAHITEQCAMQHFLTPSSSKVYIAGPMTGLPDYNRDAFFRAEAELIHHGHTVLNPAVLSDRLTQHQYMDICLAMLRSADSIYLLRGWEQSRGAKAEKAMAEKLGMVIELQGKGV
ncbi:DUF4406 domain-containing protein [Enterobacter kobei]